MSKKETEHRTLGFGEIFSGIKIVIRHAAERKEDFKPLVLITIASAILSAVMPYLWGALIDSITLFSKNGSGSLMKNPIFVLGLWLVITIAISTLEWMKAIRGRKIEETIRVQYRINAHKHLMQLPLSYHIHHKSGETQEKIVRAANGIYDVLTQTVLDAIPSFFTFLLMIGFIFFINIKFGIIALVGFSLTIILSLLNLKPMALYQREMQNAFREAYGKMSDGVNNIRVVKDFNTEKHEYKKLINDFMDVALPLWSKLNKKGRGTSYLQGLVSAITRGAVYGLSIYYILHHSMTIGQLITISGMISFAPLVTLINSRYRLQNSIIAIEDAEEMLATPIEVYDPVNSPKISKLNGDIKFENVSFAYDTGDKVFDNLSFSVEKGETIAFVGESGVGKSTLIDLLLGYYFPQNGRILFDDRENTGISLNTIRRSVGLVPQEITLFNDTVFNNVQYGSFNRTKDEVIEAARKAHCLEFIEKFPLQWDQKVGERGMKLSVGQKQRIAIARAFLKDPSILILDEPTSALDAHSEEVITQSIESLLKDRTTFIVAHRLSTVRRADRILVFKNGKLIEEGSHASLIKKKGEYSKLYKLQSKTV